MSTNLPSDARWMRAALALGRRSMGRAAPNPAVAALVVKDEVVLGRGITAPGGRPHAEPIALAEAGEGARGATLYVTLEPCSHHGRTPPCVEAVLAAGIARVVVAIRDPDSRVAGRGLARLHDAGVDVVEGVERAEAERDHRGHILRVTAGRPMVTVKMAETADGMAARAVGAERLLITGPAANACVQMLRATHDAILVGSGTVLEDDPLLTIRLPGMEGHRPTRIVLDRRLRLPLRSRLVQIAPGTSLIVITGQDAPDDRVAAFTAAGVEVHRIGTAPDGSLDLTAVLSDLGRRGLTRILCEGGPTLASALIAAGLADVVAMFTGAQVLGDPGRASLTDAARARILDRNYYIGFDAVPLGDDRLRVFEKRDAVCSQA